MKPYKDLNGNSGILTYEYDNNSIRIQFNTGKIYEYPISKIGVFHLENMKSLADSGKGLNSYIKINEKVNKGYS